MSKDWSAQPDDALLGACIAGDDHAWGALVDRYSRLVYSIPTRSGLPADVRDDVFQTVWATAVKHLEHLRDRQSVGAWLITTTQRECWRVSRKLSRETQLVVERDAVDGPNEAELVEERQRLRVAMERLDERCRELLQALFSGLDRPSYDLIASKLGIARGTIGPRRARCLERLAGLVADDTPASVPRAGGHAGG